MTTALAILIACTAAFAISTGFLLYYGKHGRRGFVWTIRMDN